METLETTERILIYTQETEVPRTLNEVSGRAKMLNDLLDQGLSNEQINEITKSGSSIENYIHKEHLKLNRELAKLEKAGIAVSATLPESLQKLKYSLLGWLNYKPHYRHGSNLEYLSFESGRWKTDIDKLEAYFVSHGWKIYVENEDLQEYKFLQKFCDYLESQKADNGQITSCIFLWQRIESNGRNKFRPRATYFKKHGL